MPELRFSLFTLAGWICSHTLRKTSSDFPLSVESGSRRTIDCQISRIRFIVTPSTGKSAGLPCPCRREAVHRAPALLQTNPGRAALGRAAPCRWRQRRCHGRGNGTSGRPENAPPCSPDACRPRWPRQSPCPGRETQRSFRRQQEVGGPNGKSAGIANLERLRRLIKNTGHQKAEHGSQADCDRRNQRGRTRRSPTQLEKLRRFISVVPLFKYFTSLLLKRSMVMAPVGQRSAQRPQRMHLSSFLMMAPAWLCWSSVAETP